jgi:hypothetical protein
VRCSYCGAPQGAAHDRSVEHGDTYRRTFTGDVAQCGCTWKREAGWGDVLHECPIHAAATRASMKGTDGNE